VPHLVGVDPLRLVFSAVNFKALEAPRLLVSRLAAVAARVRFGHDERATALAGNPFAG